MQANPSDVVGRAARFRLGIFLVGPLMALLALAMPAYAEEILRIPYAIDIGTFDPDNGFEVDGISAVNNVYEGLVEYAPGSTQIVGLLAKRWEISNDGLSYTFHLEDGVKFHDGTALTAQAVVGSLERRRDGRLVLSYMLGNVADISAPDDATVVVRLKQPQPSFLDALASAWGPKVISPLALTEHDKSDGATNWLGEHAVGTGPFKLAEFKRGEGYVLERNADYWGKSPYFDKIEIPVVPDIGQQILKLKAGELDVVPTNFPFAQLNHLPAELEVTAAPSMTQYALFIKPGSPLDNPEIRRAVLSAINPSFWVKDVFGPYAELSKSAYQNLMLDPADRIEFPSDIDAAKAAIARLGEVNLVIGLHSAKATYARISDRLIVQLALIGVKATAHVLPPGAAFALKGDPNAPDALLTISSPDAAHPENQARAFFTKDAPLNFYGRSLPEADAIVDVAGTKTDVAERNALYEKAGRLYVESGHLIPLVDVKDVVVHAKGLTDLGQRPAFPPGNIDFATVRWAR
ncbi:ABC transporter substrate-binding protein [Sinorhizobium garamanticum]|uniref:ABC transporter substrate-binding protein n=1 Tax=Sinorhizobium garamanticum TaxID=680247 RepID=A0ABY8DI59_9HYPH|nr:ABC transporter substrate-binding protein [Sinorhizobium garamanticum]WEX90589.1 ABC transporter substrate-binding protein [Sinorhizobium garamanticum]